VLSRIASKKLTTFVVWVPQLFGTQPDAIRASRLIDDPRTVHYWDGSDVTGIAFGRTLAIPSAAWDVYLLYPPGIRWTAQQPPKPAFWMQQLGVTNAPTLDAEVLAARVRELLTKGPHEESS
jgi:hypothetical protein